MPSVQVQVQVEWKGSTVSVRRNGAVAYQQNPVTHGMPTLTAAVVDLPPTHQLPPAIQPLTTPTPTTSSCAMFTSSQHEITPSDPDIKYPSQWFPFRTFPVQSDYENIISISDVLKTKYMWAYLLFTTISSTNLYLKCKSLNFPELWHKVSNLNVIQGSIIK